MTDPETPIPEPENDALEQVDALGGDADIMESLPEEGSPLTSETEYDALDQSQALDDGEPDIFPEDDPDAGPVRRAGALPGDLMGDLLYTESTNPYDFLDIDVALASVATLGDVVKERVEAERAELQVAQAAQKARERAEAERRALRPVQAPAAFSLRRGQMASVVPALTLILVGAWLTFASTAPGAVPASPLLVAVVLGAAVVLTLLSAWLSSGRWSRGVFFFAVLALLVAGVIYAQSMAAITFGLVGPLILLAVAVAFGLTGIIARPPDRRLLLPGLLFLVAGAVALAATLGYVPSALIAGAAPYWPVLVAALAVLWLLPVVVKRRG